VIIRFSNRSDIPQIRNLMKIVFGDSDLYLDLFLKYKYKDNCALIEENGTIISAAFLLQATFHDVPILYVYACATHPKFRGKGLMNEILHFAHQISITQNLAGICLVPASVSLFTYYHKLGFENHFYNKKYVFDLSDFKILKSNTCRLSFISSEQYLMLRTKEFKIYNALEWDKNHYDLVEKEYVKQKGGYFKIQNTNTDIGIGFLYTSHFKCFVTELITKQNMHETANCIFNTLEINTIEIITPEKETCNGMIKWNPDFEQKQNSGYLAFSLE
jgi:predicted N-acetyltransferase YhbS